MEVESLPSGPNWAPRIYLAKAGPPGGIHLSCKQGGRSRHRNRTVQTAFKKKVCHLSESPFSLSVKWVVM